MVPPPSTALECFTGINRLPELAPWQTACIEASTTHDPMAFPGFQGMPVLRNAFAARTDGAADHTLITNGATQAIHAVVTWLARTGGRAVLHRPAWSYFEEALDFAGVNRTDWDGTSPLPDLDARRPAALFVTDPINPTFARFTDEQVSAIARWIEAAPDRFIILDAIYRWHVPPGDHLADWRGAIPPDRFLRIDGISKYSGLFAARIGALEVPRALWAWFAEHQRLNTFGLNSVGQWTALEALERTDEVLSVLHQALARRHTMVRDALDDTSVDVLNDDVGMYAYLRGPGLDADRLERAGLRTKPATVFGLDHGVRVNIARPIDVVEQALHIIQQTAHA